jgi:hypothetical protein
MTLKEKLLVGVGALLLTNTSIILTLVLTGFFGENEPEPVPDTSSEAADMEAVSAEAARIAAIVDKYKFTPSAELPAVESRLTRINSISEAMYLCGDKTDASSATPKSYAFDHNASYYDAGLDVYMVFLTLETPSTADAEGILSDVTCEVEAATKTITNFKIMAKAKTEEPPAAE